MHYNVYQVNLINKFPEFNKLCYNYHTFKTLHLKSQQWTIKNDLLLDYLHQMYDKFNDD